MDIVTILRKKISFLHFIQTAAPHSIGSCSYLHEKKQHFKFTEFHVAKITGIYEKFLNSNGGVVIASQQNRIYSGYSQWNFDSSSALCIVHQHFSTGTDIIIEWGVLPIAQRSLFTSHSNWGAINLFRSSFFCPLSPQLRTFQRMYCLMVNLFIYATIAITENTISCFFLFGSENTLRGLFLMAISFYRIFEFNDELQFYAGLFQLHKIKLTIQLDQRLTFV